MGTTGANTGRYFEDEAFIEWLEAHHYPTTADALAADNVDPHTLYLQYVGDLRTLLGDGTEQ